MIDTRSFMEAIRDLNLELMLTILLTLTLLIIGIWIGRYSLHREIQEARYHQRDNARQTWWDDFWQGLSTELFGAVITTLSFGVILLVFQQYQTIANDKTDLVLQMSSPNNAFAVEAVRVAGQKGWLFDGTLHDAQLIGANLEGVDLISANMRNANLFEINLQGADLAEIHLEGADLRVANLQDTFMLFANLEGADLKHADLQRADLGEANLSGANLESAIIHDTNLEDATLPDGTVWTSGTDMERFTNADHPEYETTLVAINALRAEMGFTTIE